VILALSFAFLAGWELSAAPAQSKVLRLRHGSISTPPRPTPAVSSDLASAAPLSGLFLVQFEGPIESTWAGQLGAAGVQLLRYVPDDAFVARFSSVQPVQLRALPFVRWMGPYRPEYKLDERLHTNQQAEIRILLAPGSSAVDLVTARSRLRRPGPVTATRFGAILRGEATPAQLQGLIASDAVLWIEPAPHFRLVDEISSKIVGGNDGMNGTRTTTQQLGFDGTGVRVAVADSGLNNGDAATMHPDLAGRVDAFFYYGFLTDAADEHSHGTHVTGIIAGNAATGETDENGFLYGLGVAPGAHIVVQRIFDGVGNFEAPASNEVLTRDAVRAGAVIGSNSWGDDVQGRYDLSAAEFDALVRDADAGTPGDQPYILEFSAGNAGPGAQTLDSPAVAKNVIATGASQNDRFDFFIYAEGQDAMADFSSRGPCEDGRIKPDVVAPGTWISSLQSESATDENAWAPIDPYYQYQGGTSQAGPHASGSAAVFVQYYRATHGGATPFPALVKAALINSAADMDDGSGTGPVPNSDEGWGRIDLARLIASPRRYEFLDQTNLLSTGQVFEHRVVVATSGEPLKITLAYTDVPGFQPAIPALVNDLDLEVVAPDGRIYRGNQFDQGESVPDASSGDSLNNVEGVHLAEPAPGEYLVRVHARNVPMDACKDTAAVDQDFALVISGDLPLPGQGGVFFDRGAYRAPDVIQVKLIDRDLAGQPAVNVTITSTTEPVGETLTLAASGPLGVFTNRIATATDPIAADGILQISHGDAIAATYQDASPSSVRTAEAVADLVPPVLTAVLETNRFGKAIISWTSDEPATSVVRYGTNAQLTLGATNSVLREAHEIELGNLLPGVIYPFLVISADAAGNLTTNSNGGALFSFVAAPAQPILLVNAYTPADPLFGTVDLPVTTYTDALDQSGLSYEVWETADRGMPLLNDLRPFRVVIWRINDNPLADDTINLPQQSALQGYVSGGGSLLLSSMELLTRLGDVPFRTNVLQAMAFSEDAGVDQADGADAEDLTRGMVLPLDYTVFDSDLLQLLSQSPDVADTISISPDAAPIFFDDSTGEVAGLRFPRVPAASGGRVVFLAFPLEAISTTDPPPNNRAAVMRNLLRFLAPGANGLGTLALNSSAYTLPSQVTIELGDSDLAGKGQAAVEARNSTTGAHLTVSLFETVRPGLLRGAFTLVNAALAGPGQLRASQGDTLSVEYLDASAGTVVTATALVDTVPPAITNILVTPDYETAEVSWDTSKPSDALVQFWETSAGFPRNRTAYQNELSEGHSLTLAGLLPNRGYSFQVVSRDAAGNTAVDDNGGRYYGFVTLQPITLPWMDTLEAGATNWTVYDPGETQVSWRLGPPNNDWESEAHSPSNAWGSNLDGDAIDFVESYLISPAIDLTGGNTATLRFWHSFDFTSDDLESGDLQLIMNNTVVSLAAYDSDAVSWTEEEIDLTPYLGHVIYLTWHYLYLSLTLEPSPRPGWLIDDVSVTVSNTVRGTVMVTNNLSQARFSVSGPVSRTGEGTSLTLTNLPLGRYSVSFSAVPYYQTPAAQTKDLTSTAPVVFEGLYTFTDANQNGMPDAWEQQTFGEVAPGRTPVTDTDSDGVTDLAEFVAGTDPRNSASRFEVPPPVVLANGDLKFTWASVPARSYRILASPDLRSWTVLADWSRATAASSALVVRPSSAAGGFFRLEVMP
jgi:hypothetical protein